MRQSESTIHKSREQEINAYLSKPLQTELEIIKLSPAELASILARYTTVYTNNLTNDQVSMSKGSFREGTAKIDGMVFTVTFTDAQAKNLTREVLAKLAYDDELIELLYARHDNVLRLYQDAGYDLKPYGLQPMTKTEFRTEFGEHIEGLNKEIALLDFSSGLKMILYTDSEYRIVGREFVSGQSPNEHLDIPFPMPLTGRDQQKTLQP